MDAISIRCKACQHPMKFSADKAGKEAKCPKCGTVVAIQAEPKAPPPTPAPAPADDPDMIKLAPMPDIVQGDGGGKHQGRRRSVR